MKHLKLYTLATLTVALAACGKTSSTPAAATGASSVITVTPMSTTVAPSGTTTVSVTGGSNSYVSAIATQGTLLQTAANTYFFTAPATATTAVVTLTVTDSTGATGTGVIMLSGTTSGGTTGGTAFTSTACGGQFTVNAGGTTGTLNLTQDVSNNVGGYLFLPSYSYYFPVSGTCAVTVGATSGTLTLTAFTNTSANQTYTGSITSNGGQLMINGSVTSSAGTFTFTATSTALSAAPVAESQACGGSYNVNIAGTTGVMRLVHNGSGTLGGYLTLQGYYYAMTGTCGSSVSLRNLTTNSSYTGTATFSGASVSMAGNFTTSDGSTYTWTANK